MKFVTIYHNKLFISYFGIKKMIKLVVKKYYRNSFNYNIKICLKELNNYFAQK